MKWQKKFETGIKEIDEQHKKLIEMINSVEKSFDLKELFSELIEYSRVHFTTEEALFKEYDYPKSREHILEHQKIIQNILKLEGEDLESNEIKETLMDILENHLLTFDKEYVKFFKEKGVAK